MGFRFIEIAQSDYGQHSYAIKSDYFFPCGCAQVHLNLLLGPEQTL